MVIVTSCGWDSSRPAVVTRMNRAPLRRDSSVDAHNNAAGQAWGHTHEHHLAGQSLRAVLDAATAAARTKWDAGELAH